MIAFEKVLVCLDQSEMDETVLVNACEFSKLAGTTDIIFLNVIRDFNLPESLVKEFPDLLDKAIEERREAIHKAVGAHFNCLDINVKVLIRQGEATKEILTTSSEEDADLIILGREKGSDSVLGTRIARRATCSLLFITANSELSLNNIHVPVDFSNYSELSIEAARNLAKDTSAKIYLHNVYSVPSSYRYSGKTYKQFAEIMKKNAAKDLKVMTRNITFDEQQMEPVFTLGESQNVIRLVYEEAVKEKADLIVMGAKGRTAASALFIGSKAERMIHIDREIPLLVIRKKNDNAGIFASLQEF